MTTGNPTLWSLVLLLWCTACNEEAKEPVKTGVSAENLFLEYQVWGDEERGIATALLQLRQKNNNGKTVKLEQPGFVELDGEVLQPDSSRMTGFFYEVQKPLESFGGRHKITIQDENKDQVSEEFEYTPFTLSTPLGKRVRKQPFQLSLSGLKNEDRLRIILVDTVFNSPDINELVPVVNGRLQVTRELLQDVRTGPVTLLLFKEEDRRIQNPAVKGGKIAITYGLKREFDLVP
jgi:hypothetical protein